MDNSVSDNSQLNTTTLNLKRQSGKCPSNHYTLFEEERLTQMTYDN